MKDIIILGISAFYHDSAAALIINGEIVAAAEEERFSRKKHDSSFPVKSIKYCLNSRRFYGNKFQNTLIQNCLLDNANLSYW